MMPQVNELNISINKAIITDITLRLTKTGLRVDVVGDLLTAQGKRISGFNFSTNHWDDDAKMELPFEINNPARQIFELLTPAVYSKIEGEFKQLGTGAKKGKKVEVNYDDIPF